jgi:hypothetical protein
VKLGIIATQTADGIDAGPAFSFDDVLVASSGRASSAARSAAAGRGLELTRAPLALGRPVAKVARTKMPRRRG